MRKKTLSALLCTVAAMAVLTGCGGDKKETAAAPAEANTTAAVTEAAKTEAETTAAAQTEAGGEKNLVMPSASCVANLNPLLEGYKEAAMLNPIYDPLYVIDVNETRYYLADSYEVSEDGMQITVKLKEGLKWHDGEAITADDMIFTMDVCSDTNNGAGGTNIVILNDQPVKYEKVDDLTVKVTLPMASASYADLLGGLTPIPEHVFEGNPSVVSAGEANMKGSAPVHIR